MTRVRKRLLLGAERLAATTRERLNNTITSRLSNRRIVHFIVFTKMAAEGNFTFQLVYCADDLSREL